MTSRYNFYSHTHKNHSMCISIQFFSLTQKITRCDFSIHSISCVNGTLEVTIRPVFDPNFPKKVNLLIINN